MIELVEEKRDIGEKQMNEMRPLEVCVLKEPRHVVMRTASWSKFEVMDLSQIELDGCWTRREEDLLVRELLPGEEYTLRLFKE